MDIAKLSSKGQVTIPISIRRKLGLYPGENVIFIERSNNVFIASAQEVNASISDRWSEGFISAFSHFNETTDDSFFEPDEIPSKFNTDKVDFK